MKSFVLSLFLALTCAVSFGQSARQMKTQINTAALPKDVLDKKYILLVKLATDDKSLVEQFRKAMENYKGNFDIVGFHTKVDASYPDANQYRYVLAVPASLTAQDFTGANALVANATGGVVKTNNSSINFQIVDRKELNKVRNTNLSGPDAAKVLAYIAARLSGVEPTDN